MGEMNKEECEKKKMMIWNKGETGSGRKKLMAR